MNLFKLLSPAPSGGYKKDRFYLCIGVNQIIFDICDLLSQGMRKQKVTIALCILLALMCSFVSISVAVAGAMPATAGDANYGTEESGYAETPLFTAYVQHSNRNGTKGDGIGKIKFPTYADHADVPEKAQDEDPTRWLVNDPNGGQEKTVTYTHERNHKHWLGGESPDNEHIK